MTLPGAIATIRHSMPRAVRGVVCVPAPGRAAVLIDVMTTASGREPARAPAAPGRAVEFRRREQMQDAGLIAGRYAQALSDAVRDGGEFQKIREEIHLFAELFRKSPELRHAFANPVIPAAAKKQVAQTIGERTGVSPTTLRFLAVLARHERLVLLPEMAEAVDGVADRRFGVHEVEIRSAAPLSDDVRARLTQALQDLAGGKIRISERVDPELLGGVVARVGATIYDGSLKTKLETLRSRMAGGAGSRLAG